MPVTWGGSEHPRRDARLRRTYLSGYLELQDALEIHEGPWGYLVIQPENSEIAEGKFFAIWG